MKSLGLGDNLPWERKLLFNEKFKTLSRTSSLGEHIFSSIMEMLLPSPDHILKSTGF
jgi:hypothetical protein